MADNILTYILELQDKISPKLTVINITNDKMLDKWAEVQVKMNAAKKSMSDTGNSIGSLNEKIAALRMQREWIPGSNTAAIRATNHEIQRLEKQVKRLENLDGGKFKKWMKDITKSLPAFVNPLSLMFTGVAKSVQKGKENELQKQNITSLLAGDTVAADKLFGQISEYGKKTVYDKADLIEAQKTMMSFGLSGEKSFNTLKQIGDIAMGDSQKMQSLALAFSQATSAGKLQGQDFHQLVNAGFNPLQVISEHTGKSMSQLQDEMSKGQISAEMLAQAFTWATEEGGLFYQGAEKAGQTMSGRMNQLKDSFDELLINAFGAIQPILSPLIDFATKIISTVGNGIGNVIQLIKDGHPVMIAFGAITAGVAAGMLALKIQTLAMAAIQGIKAVADKVVTLSTLGWKAAMDALNLSFLASPIFLVVAVIVAIGTAIVWVCSKITGWGSLWKGVVGFMKYSFYAFIDGIKAYFLTWAEGFMIGLDKIRLGWYKFKEALGIGDSAENQAAIAEINEDVERRKQAVRDAAEKVTENAIKAKESLQGIEMGWKKSEKSTSGGGLKDKLGINGQLEASVNGGLDGKDGKDDGDSETDATTSAIATGGTRNTTVNINLGKMVESINFNGGFGENAGDIEKKFEELFLRVLYMAQNA